MYEVLQLIAGRWEPGGAGHDLTVRNPADDMPVTRAAVSSAEDAAAAVRAAREAGPGWARTPAAERGAALHAAATAIEAAAVDLAETMSAETGRPVADARDSIMAGVRTLRQYAELGPVHRGRALAGREDAVDLMAHQPRGVVAVITPWNDPVAVSCGLLGAALATGNTVVYKPSERAPATGWHLARLLAPHLPDGVLGLLNAELPVLSLALTCGPITVIELSGDVDLSTAHLITELVTRVSEKHPSQVILDMTEVSFFCAAGVTALLRARETIEDAGGELMLRHPSTITMRILTTTGTAATFPIDRHSVPRNGKRDLI